MYSFNTEATIRQEGELHLEHLPFHEGEKVKVTISKPDVEQLRKEEYEMFMKGYAEEDSVYDKLPVEQRMQIVRELWDSIVEDESMIPVSEEDKAEVRRRLELLRRGELQTESWESMRARIVANRP